MVIADYSYAHFICSSSITQIRNPAISCFHLQIMISNFNIMVCAHSLGQIFIPISSEDEVPPVLLHHRTTRTQCNSQRERMESCAHARSCEKV